MTALPTICWLPGWAGNNRIWTRPQSALNAYRHLSPDYDGVTNPGDFIDRVAACLPATPCILVAWSLGGMLALEAAANMPMVQGLVVCGGTGCFVNRHRDLGWPPAILRRMQRNLDSDPTTTIRQFIAEMFADTDRAQHFIDTTYPHGLLDDCSYNAAALDAGLQYLADTDLSDSIENVRCPVLWFHGIEDSICPIGAGRAAADKLVNCQFVELPGGHLPAFETSDALTEHLVAFIRNSHNA